MFVTVPLRRIVKVTTTRGAVATLGSTVDCSQLPLMRRCTASTYHENREPKSPPAAPVNPSPACVVPAPRAKEVVGTVGVPPPPYGIAFGGGGVGFSSSFDGRVTYFGGLLRSNFGIGVASGAGFGCGVGSDLNNPFDSSTTRLADTTSGLGSGIAGTLPTIPTVIEPPGPPQFTPLFEKYAEIAPST